MTLIAIRVEDGTTMSAYLDRPKSLTSSTAVIVIHELFGVSPDIRELVDELASEGILAVAPEFYHRDAPAGLWFERDDDGRASAFEQLNMLNRDSAVFDVAGAIERILEEPGITDVAVVGFSAGGHLAYLAAARLPITTTIVLYAGWLPTTDIPLSRPEPTLSLSGDIRGRLVYLVGAEDSLIDAAHRAEIGAALDGVDHEFVTYPGVGHAFFWPGTPTFDEAARADAWQRILAEVRTPSLA